MKKKLLCIMMAVTILMTLLQNVAYASYVGQIDVPECLSEEVLDIYGSSMRLPEEETDLNSIVYQNLDGTRTLYYFQDAVKYVDSNGQIQDKSNKLYHVSAGKGINAYAYQNVYNDIITSFPETLSQEQGILVKSDDIKIEMVPLSNPNVRTAVTGVELQDETTISYADVFGSETSVRYSPTFNGVKEEIVLFQKPESNTFSFLLNTGNIEAVKEGAQISLYDQGKKVGFISEVIVYDSDKESNATFDNEVLLTPTEVPGEYIYTISLDEEFVSSNSTVYPIYVDPTITINASGSGTTKTIIDAPVYSGIPSVNQGSNIYNRIGYVGTSGNINYGIGRTLMKFPGLMSNSLFLSLADSEITDVSLMLAEVSGKSASAIIRAHYYTGAAWSETGVTYNNCSWNGLGTTLSSVTVSGSSTSYRTFNITTAAKQWRNDPALADKGIIIRNVTSETDTSYEKAFSASEASTNKPYVTVTYTMRSFTPLTVINRYDNGYLTYYGDTAATAQSKISGYISSVSSRYSSLIGLTLSSATPSYYKSTCDQCKGTVTTSNINTLCSDSTDHTNIATIHSDFQKNVTVGSTSKSILWSAHKISCDYGSASGISYNRSVTYSKKYIYSIAQYTSSARTERSKSLVMHELNHTIGASDHYHELLSNGSCRGGAICSVCGTNPRPTTCTMYTSTLSISNTDIICSQCICDIRTYLIANGYAK